MPNTKTIKKVKKIKLPDEVLRIFLWLDGQYGDFPDLSERPHYKFRSSLREKLEKIGIELKPITLKSN